MQKIILFLTIVFVIASCRQKDKKTSENKESFSDGSSDTYANIKVNWYDSLLSSYIEKTDNAVLKFSRQDTTIRIKWFLDRVEKTDSSKYFIIHIGHEVVDEDNTNPRFVTDGWVYIDSLTKMFYEYDLPNDNLIKWGK